MSCQNELDTMKHKSDILVDARGLACPMPLLKLKQAIKQAGVGQVIKMVATDPSSQRDCVSFIKASAHQLELKTLGKEYHFRVVKH